MHHVGEPNGGELENCIQVWPHKNSWNDYRCGYRAVSFCNIEGTPRFQIRGIADTLLTGPKPTFGRNKNFQTCTLTTIA